MNQTANFSERFGFGDTEIVEIKVPSDCGGCGAISGFGSYSIAYSKPQPKCPDISQQAKPALYHN